MVETMGKSGEGQGVKGSEANDPVNIYSVKVSHEDMVFLRALVYPQPSPKVYGEIIDGYVISLWESLFEDGFSIGAYESDRISCVLTYTEGSDYCEMIRLQVREVDTKIEHCILWSEVGFIEKKGDEIIVTGCRMYERNGDETNLVNYDLCISDEEAIS